MSEILRVSDELRLQPQLVRLKERGGQLALVVDEYGGSAVCSLGGWSRRGLVLADQFLEGGDGHHHVSGAAVADVE